MIVANKEFRLNIHKIHSHYADIHKKFKLNMITAYKEFRLNML